MNGVGSWQLRVWKWELGIKQPDIEYRIMNVEYQSGRQGMEFSETGVIIAAWPAIKP